MHKFPWPPTTFTAEPAIFRLKFTCCAWLSWNFYWGNYTGKICNSEDVINMQYLNMNIDPIVKRVINVNFFSISKETKSITHLGYKKKYNTASKIKLCWQNLEMVGNIMLVHLFTGECVQCIINGFSALMVLQWIMGNLTMN